LPVTGVFSFACTASAVATGAMGATVSETVAVDDSPEPSVTV